MPVVLSILVYAWQGFTSPTLKLRSNMFIKVASRPSSPPRSPPHDTLAPSSEFSFAPVLPHPGFVDGQRFLSDPTCIETCISSFFGSSFFTRLYFRLIFSDSSSNSSSDTSSGSPSDSLLDSSSVHSSGCDTSAPTLTDLLPPRKRFRDSYSPKVSREEHIEIGTADAEAIVDLGIDDGVGAPNEDGIGMGVEVAASDIREDEE
ncbi:hypothetical protein Tco_0551514 [Tanacetum coccineum]